MRESTARQHVVRLLGNPQSVDAAFDAAIDRFRRTAGDGRFECAPTRGPLPAEWTRARQSWKVLPGRSERSVLLVHEQSGSVAEIVVKAGIARQTGFYADIEEARRDGWTEEEIDKHVAIH